MKGKKMLILIPLLVFVVFLSACTPDGNGGSSSNGVDQEKLEEKNEKITTLEEEITRLEEENMQIEELQERINELEETSEDESQNLLNDGADVLALLKNKNMEALKEFIHPEKGLRFSAYPYVDPEEDIVISKDELVDKFSSDEEYVWGNYDGKGTPIELSFSDYYDEFIYDENFLEAPIIGRNRVVSSGNTIDNVEEAYEEADFLEFYFDGFNEEYAGADWRSLKLVFEKDGNTRYLVGIIHGEWTI